MSSFQPGLEIVRIHDRSPSFSFGVPLGWRDLEEGELKSAGPDAITGVIRERSDQVITGLTVMGAYDKEFPEFSGPRGPRFLMAHAQDLAHARTQAPRQGAIGPAQLSEVQKGYLAGDPAVIIRFRQPAEFKDQAQGWAAETEVWTVHRGHLYSLEMTGPEELMADYRPDFNTILGTWQWRS